jgi:hypothetical protein
MASVPVGGVAGDAPGADVDRDVVCDLGWDVAWRAPAPGVGIRPAATSASSERTSSSPGLSAGFLVRRAVSTGASGPAWRIGAGSSFMTAASVASCPSRWNGVLPSTAVYSVAPSDHRSDGGAARSPRARSGARYAGDPMIAPLVVRVASPSSAAAPKSVSTTTPRSSIITLDGLTSR